MIFERDRRLFENEKKLQIDMSERAQLKRENTKLIREKTKLQRERLERDRLERDRFKKDRLDKEKQRKKKRKGSLKKIITTTPNHKYSNNSTSFRPNDVELSTNDKISRSISILDKLVETYNYNLLRKYFSTKWKIKWIYIRTQFHKY